MKRILSKLMLFAIVTFSLLVPCAPTFAAENVTTPPVNNYEIVDQMGLGYNLGKTFAQTLANNQNEKSIRNRIDAAYAAGFNTIRIPVQWSLHMDDAGHIVKDDITVLLESTVNYCMKKNLYVILGSMGDLGEDANSRWDLPDVVTQEFVTEYTNMWSDISDMFSDCNYHLIFEGYNEAKNMTGDITGYGYNYSNGTSRADSYYFAGRCGNLANMMSLNATFADIMSDVAPDRYYMISSYNADPRSAYTDYTNMTWENKEDHYVNGSWNNTWFLAKDVNVDKAIYNCHIYKYGSDFESEIKTLKSAFDKRGIKLPIYVDENGTHTSAFKGSSVNSQFVTPVSFMTGTLKSGLCLWDDTQSMSYLDISDYTWYNDNLIKAMVDAAGQNPR